MCQDLEEILRLDDFNCTQYKDVFEKKAIKFRQKKCIDKQYVADSFFELYKLEDDDYFEDIVNKKGKNYETWKKKIEFFSSGFFYDSKHGMINFHSLMTVLYIASSSKQDEKLEFLFDLYFTHNFDNEDMIIRDHAYYFILKAHLAVINYSMICGFQKVQNVI